MRIIIFYAFYVSISSVYFNFASGFKCKDFNGQSFLGYIFDIFSNINFALEPKFYFLSNEITERVQFGINDWSILKKLQLNKKTIIIVHGYTSNSKRYWVVNLKDQLLSYKDVNIILVDWKDGSYSLNYDTSAGNSEIVANKLFNFLQLAKAEIEFFNRTSDVILWNHLYFIGHSIGAHISGQTAHLLKQDPFWKVERITGLDPAEPCFKEIGIELRLDKNDADFVDIIHTQVRANENEWGFGMMESIGHVDFYINGGVVQPKCHLLFFEFFKQVCSHLSSHKYFSESITNAINKNDCKFIGHKWNGTFVDAINILEKIKLNQPYSNGPEMGIDADKSNQTGKFLVITGTKEPYCHFSFEDVSDVTKSIRELEKKD